MFQLQGEVFNLGLPQVQKGAKARGPESRGWPARAPCRGPRRPPTASGWATPAAPRSVRSDAIRRRFIERDFALAKDLLILFVFVFVSLAPPRKTTRCGLLVGVVEAKQISGMGAAPSLLLGHSANISVGRDNRSWRVQVAHTMESQKWNLCGKQRLKPTCPRSCIWSRPQDPKWV